MDRESVRELNKSAFSVMLDLRRHTEVLLNSDETVVCRVRFSGRAAQGGGDVELAYAEVTIVRDGVIVRRDIYSDETEALAAATAP
jgi:ketosteroid isomerase-like protein